MKKFEDYMQKWIPQEKNLLPFYEGVSNFVKDNLDYSVSIDEERISSKIIADPLIGYIHLNPVEIAIIDTPLFQRLRRISQLGLAYMVYPSLNYSRFEHSLGVLGHLNKIIIQVIDNYNKKKESAHLDDIVKNNECSLRFAALLHYIGHCLFSHCSERVISSLQGVAIDNLSVQYPSADFIQKTFSDHFNKEIPLAEILTVSIIGTKEFSEFIIKLDILKRNETITIIENCCRFILGLPIKKRPETLFLAQLISSGFDVDKVDYMLREQHYTGIKLEIDLDRIIGKLNVFDLQSQELPEQLRYLKSQFDANDQFKALGFSKGGQFVFEEFCIARLALNVKIYLHQKIRTAEGQLSKILKDISDNMTSNNPRELKKVHNWLKIPEDILQYPEVLNLLFSNQVSDSLFPQDVFVDPKQIELLKDIKDRKLYCRAFAFGPINSNSETTIVSNDHSEDKEFDFFLTYDEREMRTEILRTIKEILSLLEKNFDESELENFIVDNPRLRFKNIQQGHKTLFFERPHFAPFRWTIPLDKIGVYFEESRAFGYVFATKRLAPYFSVATEKVVFDLNKKVFAQEGNISRITYDDMGKLKKELTDKGYYAQTPELRELSEYLKSAEAAEKIMIVQDKLSLFSSIITHDRITINKITTFVNQFPNDLQKACMVFLEGLEIYDVKLLENEISTVIIGVCFEQVVPQYIGFYIPVQNIDISLLRIPDEWMAVRPVVAVRCASVRMVANGMNNAWGRGPATEVYIDIPACRYLVCRNQGKR